MGSKINDPEKKQFFADLKAELVYIVLPLVVLILVKLTFGDWTNIVLAPDWSLASCVVFGQVTFKISKAVAQGRGSSNPQLYGLYTAKRFFCIVLSLSLYFIMLIKPSFLWGVLQMLLFFYAVFVHFSDGVGVALMHRSKGLREREELLRSK